jgi:hypothetical protein
MFKQSQAFHLKFGVPSVIFTVMAQPSISVPDAPVFPPDDFLAPSSLLPPFSALPSGSQPATPKRVDKQMIRAELFHQCISLDPSFHFMAYSLKGFLKAWLFTNYESRIIGLTVSILHPQLDSAQWNRGQTNNYS